MTAFNAGTNKVPLAGAPVVERTFRIPEPVNVEMLTLFDPEATVLELQFWLETMVHGLFANDRSE
jgi:hypothetical protein